jgi:putative membrane protein
VRADKASLAALAVLLLPAAALAHGAHHDHQLTASTVLRWWSWDPLVLLGLAVSAWLYVRGVARLWRRAGAGKGIKRWEAVCFALGWLALFTALVSPLDALGEVLFSAHMAQHEVLILLAAPLLVLGRPLVAWLWALAPEWREPVTAAVQARPVAAVWHAVTGPFAAFMIHAAALWIWHIPALYQATLENDAVHAVQHLSFFLSATLFWWALIHGRYGKMGYGVAVFYVFATAMHSGVLGALITFAPRLLYPIYGGRTAAWGLSPLEDQQLAGLLMWVPAGVLFIVLGLARRVRAPGRLHRERRAVEILGRKGGRWGLIRNGFR